MKARNGRASRHKPFIFLLFLININTIAQKENTIDYVVAVVNDEAITQSALENEPLLNHLLWKSDLQVQEVRLNSVIVLSGGEDYGLVSNSIVEVLDQETRQKIAHARIKQVDPRRATAVISDSPTQTVKIGHFVQRPLVEIILLDVRTILNELIDRKLMMQEADRLGIPLARWKGKIDEELKATLNNEILLKEINQKFGLEVEEIREWLRTKLILNEFRDRRFGRTDNLKQQAAEYYSHHPNEFYDQKLSRKRSFEEVLQEIQNRLRNQINIDLEEWLKQQRSSSYILKL